ncbi:MAG: GxxExxY protein [Paludibacteraceae bacterium]|nr:GxxExxY protein [Prevotellaceae bacterium]
MIHEELTSKIIKAAYNVYNVLGGGFLEKVYHNAMLIELDDLGLMVDSEKPIKVQYKGVTVGDYYADIVVDGDVIVELKAVENLSKVHEIQLVNYLSATSVDVGLLVNFGSAKVEVKRKYREYKNPANPVYPV